VRSNPVALIWLLGALVGVVVYVGGVDDILAQARTLVADTALLTDITLWRLANVASELIPALATGALVAFVPLAILAIRAGQRGRVALLAVPAVFVWLTGTGYASRMNWLEALLLAGSGAAIMTLRLRSRPSGVLRVN